MNGVTTAWIAQLIIITYRDLKPGSTHNIGGLPLPADYLASFAIFGALGLIGGDAAKPAGVAAWGFVIASFLNLFPSKLVPSTSSSASSSATTSSTKGATNG